jgi:hypothetical protein
MVIKHRLDPLLPLPALLREPVTKSDLCAQVKEMGGRNPGLRDPPGHQQLSQMASIRAVVLRTLLAATHRRCFRRLGEMHLRADALQFLNDEPPAGRGLQRDLKILAVEALQEPTDTGAVRRHHTRARNLPGAGVNPVSRDLCSMLVCAHYDRHSGPPQAPRCQRLRGPAPRLS